MSNEHKAAGDERRAMAGEFTYDDKPCPDCGLSLLFDGTCTDCDAQHEPPEFTEGAGSLSLRFLRFLFLGLSGLARGRVLRHGVTIHERNYRCVDFQPDLLGGSFALGLRRPVAPLFAK